MLFLVASVLQLQILRMSMTCKFWSFILYISLWCTEERLFAADINLWFKYDNFFFLVLNTIFFTMLIIDFINKTCLRFFVFHIFLADGSLNLRNLDFLGSGRFFKLLQKVFYLQSKIEDAFWAIENSFLWAISVSISHSVFHLIIININKMHLRFFHYYKKRRELWSHLICMYIEITSFE